MSDVFFKETDLLKAPRHFDADIAKQYVKRLADRQFNLAGKNNATKIAGRPAHEVLWGVLENWERMIEVM